MSPSYGLRTHRHADGRGSCRIVEHPDGTLFVGFLSEETGQRMYVAVTRDGRGHVAAAETQVEAQREVCDALGLDRRRVIGKAA